MRYASLGLIAWFSVGMLGCTDVVNLYAPCPNRSYDDTDGNLDPCVVIRAECPGGCIPAAPDEWNRPIGLWIGSEAEAPDCESKAFTGYIWHDPSPKECAACRCEHPTGTCTLPTKFTANGATCTPPPGTPTYSFDAPASWDGTCTAASPVTTSVQSLSIGAMKIKETVCEPAMDPTPARVTDATPVAYGLGCIGEPGEAGCGNSGAFCAIFGPLKDYRQCIWKSEKHACPVDLSPRYSERFIFYQTYEDKRGCSECVCGVPRGSTCTAQISVYSNNACAGNPIEEWTHQSTSPVDPAAPPGCKDILVAATSLNSKQASAPIYTPGTCEPYGGNPIGSIVGSGEVHTACCIPQP